MEEIFTYFLLIGGMATISFFVYKYRDDTDFYKGTPIVFVFGIVTFALAVQEKKGEIAWNGDCLDFIGLDGELPTRIYLFGWLMIWYSVISSFFFIVMKCRRKF